MTSDVTWTTFGIGHPSQCWSGFPALLAMSRGQLGELTDLSLLLGRGDVQAGRGENQVVFRFLDVVPGLGIEQQRLFQP